MIGSEQNRTETAEERLLRENEELKRKVSELQVLVPASTHEISAPAVWRPSKVTLWSVLLAVLVLLALAFVAGFVPLQKRNAELRAEAAGESTALPVASVMTVGRSSTKSELQLPGSIQAVTEAPILARAEGYVRKRYVDIGDRVKAGQALAEIEAPELVQQVLQSKANLEQAQAALEQAQANYQQGKSNLELARVTAQRWGNLGARGVVSKQENDQYQAQYLAQQSNVQALEKAIAAQRSNVAAAEANLARLRDMQNYRIVRAPFDGVITLRNVDVGALVNTGSTLLFRVAQTNVLRMYINVPQTNASSVRPGQAAQITVSNLPGRTFAGNVARSANSLDAATRTLLVEVRVPNADGALLPGTYAQVSLASPRTNPPILIPSDALVVGSTGTMVAQLQTDHTVHLQHVQVGRDYGDKLEVLSGLNDGDSIVLNPGDLAREGLKVEPRRGGK